MHRRIDASVEPMLDRVNAITIHIFLDTSPQALASRLHMRVHGCADCAAPERAIRCVQEW
ncbi:hypothetical protein [Bradyrhizobium sp. UNPF46]|uniref:hypothetical protein n=1 Tax=Bradyrhizobium sp. UNPF46 TaxID=1141168 RepID=UPI0015F0B5CB|nr:hypothetical protein [Bradyrhizobium sp. UNPF46]